MKITKCCTPMLYYVKKKVSGWIFYTVTDIKLIIFIYCLCFKQFCTIVYIQTAFMICKSLPYASEYYVYLYIILFELNSLRIILTIFLERGIPKVWKPWYPFIRIEKKWKIRSRTMCTINLQRITFVRIGIVIFQYPFH